MLVPASAALPELRDGSRAQGADRPLAVCSDTEAGERSDNEDISPYDLTFPATTDVALL